MTGPRKTTMRTRKTGVGHPHIDARSLEMAKIIVQRVEARTNRRPDFRGKAPGDQPRREPSKAHPSLRPLRPARYARNEGDGRNAGKPTRPRAGRNGSGPRGKPHRVRTPAARSRPRAITHRGAPGHEPYGKGRSRSAPAKHKECAESRLSTDKELQNEPLPTATTSCESGDDHD